MSQKNVHVDENHNEKKFTDTIKSKNHLETDNNAQQQEKEAVSSPLEAMEAEIASLKDRMLRAVAESENVRRRAEADIAKAREYSIESFARDMIGVLDNLFRASDSISEEDAKSNERLKNLKDGVDMTRNEMINALAKHKIARIDPLGEKFNHNIHQAMAQVPTTDKEAGTILQVIQSGYTIKERLLRPAMVVVAKAAD